MSHDIWSIVVLFGVVAWIASTVAFLFYTFPRKDEFVAKSAIRWGGVNIVSFLVWIVGLINA